jgi:hypothetical protein
MRRSILLVWVCLLVLLASCNTADPAVAPTATPNQPVIQIKRPVRPPDRAAVNWEPVITADVIASQPWPYFGGGLGSPDGRWVARVEAGEITLSTVDGSRISRVPMPVGFEASEPVTWSPNGRQFVIQESASARTSPIHNPDVVLVDWDEAGAALSPQVIEVRGLAVQPRRVFLAYGREDRLLVFARSAFPPTNATSIPGTVYGEVRVYDMLTTRLVQTDTATEGGAILLGESIVSIDVEQSIRQIGLTDNGVRQVIPGVRGAGLIALSGDTDGKWLLLTGLEPPGAKRILTAVSRDGTAVALAEVVAATRAYAGDGVTAAEVIDPNFVNRLYLIDWRVDPPTIRDLGPVERLSGIDSANGRVLALLKDTTGATELMSAPIR